MAHLGCRVEGEGPELFSGTYDLGLRGEGLELW